MAEGLSISARFDDLGTGPADAGRAVHLGIMGGTFDPIHMGHLSCAERARDACGLDAVLFVPAGTPVFKLDQPVSDASKRLAMCRAAVDSNPAFDVSEIEIARGGSTYTIDTLHQLRAHYPDNVAFALIVGSDVLETLHKWKDAEELAKLASVIVVGRPGQPMGDEACIARLREMGFVFEFVETSGLDISSTALRAWVAEGSSIRYLVPDTVADYVSVYGLYRGGAAALDSMDELGCDDDADLGDGADADTKRPADDPFSKQSYQAMRDLLKQRVKSKRFTHSVNVAKVARKLAKTYGYDPDIARMAGILHDWDKGLTNEELRDRARDLELEIDPLVVSDMPWLLHGPTAAAALSREYPQFGDAVFQAIARHTSGAPDMAPLDCILYVADIIEPGRTFGDERGIERLRSLVGTMPLEELYFEAFKYTLEFLVSTDRVLYPATIDTWNVLMRTYGHVAKSKIDIWNAPSPE